MFNKVLYQDEAGSPTDVVVVIGTETVGTDNPFSTEAPHD